MFSLFCFLCVALCFVIYPFRCHIKQASVLVLVFSTISLSLYACLGGYNALQADQIKRDNDKQAKQALKQFKSTGEVIVKLKEAIKQNPKKAEGWYLLGRLYSSQGQNEQAKASFEKAYRLDNQSLKIRFAWMTALYVNNGQLISGEVKHLIDGILRDKPNQPDLLNFLAIDAYQHQHYDKANAYLQRLLAIVPNNSKPHDMVLKMIAETQKKIKQGV